MDTNFSEKSIPLKLRCLLPIIFLPFPQPISNNRSFELKLDKNLETQGHTVTRYRSNSSAIILYRNL